MTWRFQSSMPNLLHHLAMVAALACLPSTSSGAGPDFTREVRPILERNCFSCHGPEKQKSSYRLDIRDTALRGGDSGKAAIVPHNAQASPLFRFVSGQDPETVMPPENSDLPLLTKAELEVLRNWIDAGPEWPDALAGPAAPAKPHWSLQPLVKPAVPSTIGHPIDAFIRGKLATQKLDPSPETERRLLIRRVCYDLTGLQPTPQELATFMGDTDPQAYEKLVDRLLASPRYGERWARHWLDTIHFADSHGYEHDIGRDHAWPFRDYVIEAFNQDISWPRFIREQLAADVFFPDEPRLVRALGYLGAGTFDLSTYTTGPITFSYLDRDDLVTQTMSAFTSTTANCARCHDHKFDPIPQADYYALQAVFAGVLKGDVSYDEDPVVARERRKWRSVMTAAEKRDAAVVLVPEYQPLVDAWLATTGQGAHWQELTAETFLSAEGATLTRATNGVFISGGTRPDKDTYTITGTTTLTNLTALRVEVLADDSLPMHGPGRNENGNLHLSELELRLFRPGSTNSPSVKFRRATADFNQSGWGIERALDGDLKTAWGIHPMVGQSHQAVFELAEPLTNVAGAHLAIALKQLHGGGHLIGAFRLSVTADDPARATVLPYDVDAALTMAPAGRTETQRVVLAAQALRLAAQAELEKLPTQAVVYAAAPSVKIVGGEVNSLAEPKVVHVLKRGDFEQPGDVAQPGALSALKHSPARFVLAETKNEAARRAALADWFAHPDNVLTWRSIVNRVWHYHFGRGLCDTPSDLGRMGGTPSHPELIDWLAVWFRDEAGGSLKKLHRLIVTSATYRQSSQTREGPALADSDNRLLWRQNRQRLDADGFRDFTLATSGALNLKMGGPGIRQFKSSPGPQQTPMLDYTSHDWAEPESCRRSIYRHVWRGIADPFMEALDFPDLGLLAPVRGLSSSSLQALTLYNNDFVLHHSEVLARRVESGARTPEEQVSRAVQLAWLREPRGNELADFKTFVQSSGLPAFCRILLNSNEFLFVE